MIQPESKRAAENSTDGSSALYTLIICTFLYAINYIDKQVFSVVLQPMKVDLGLTDAQCGLAHTFFVLGTSVLSFPVAYLVDRWSRSKVISIAALLWSIFSFATGLARNFTTLIIPRSLVGVGEAGFTSGGIAMVSAAYTADKRARMLGILGIGAPLGAAIGMIAGGAISATIGWRWAFYIFALPGVILGILALFMRDYKTPPKSANNGGRWDFIASIVNLFRIRSLCLYYLGEGILSFMTVSVLAWGPALMMRVMNVSEAVAGMIVGSWGLVAIIAAPLGGWIADVWQKKTGRGRLHLPALASVMATITLVIMMLTLKTGILGVTMGFVYGLFTVIYIPALNAFSQDVVPATSKGLAVGLATVCAYVLGGAWGPSAVGAISDAIGGGGDGLSNAILLISATGFIAGLLFWLAAKTYPADMAKAQSQTPVTG